MNDVKIVQLNRGFEIWQWLCPPCIARYAARGFSVKVTKEPPHPLRCDDCKKTDTKGE